MDYQLKRQEPAGLIHSVQSWAGLIFKWWVCEIGASIISIGGSITLLVVLKNADQGPQRPWIIGNTQLTLNTVVAIVSTVIRASLIVMISGALNQSSWNWFAKKQRTDHQQLDERPKRENWYTRNEKNREMEFGRPLDDLDTFGEAASSSLACLKLLCRTKFKSHSPDLDSFFTDYSQIPRLSGRGSSHPVLSFRRIFATGSDY